MFKKKIIKNGTVSGTVLLDESIFMGGGGNANFVPDERIRIKEKSGIVEEEKKPDSEENKEDILRNEDNAIKESVESNFENKNGEIEENKNRKEETETKAEKEKTETINAISEDKMEAIYKEAYEKGVAETEQKWITKYNELEKRFMDQEAQLSHIADQFLLFKEKYFSDISLKLLDINLIVLRKILGEISEKDKMFVKDIIKNVLTKIKKEQKVVIKVNKDDYEFLNERDRNFIAELEAKKVFFEIDDSFSGGIILKGENSIIDASFDAQLSEIENYIEEYKKSLEK